MGHMGFQKVKRDYKRFQWVQGVIRSCKGLQEVTTGY